MPTPEVLNATMTASVPETAFNVANTTPMTTDVSFWNEIVNLLSTILNAIVN